ncbi:unnamed protein product [Caenorhabditis brenneri]
MGLPILRLPVVALKVLLDYMNNVELVTVSQLSKRADWFLRACGKKKVSFFDLEGSEIRYLRKITILELFLQENKRQGVLPEWSFELFCSVGFDLHISISCENFIVPIHFEALENIGRFGRRRRNLKIGELVVPVVTTRENDGVEKIRTFWNTKADGMIVLMDYFNNNFNLSIDELKFSGSTNGIRQIVNHIKSNQMVVNNVQVYPSPSENDFGSIVENVSATESFFSHLNLSQNFKYCKAIHAKEIKIRLGHWFTIQSLIASTESEVIDVRGSDYTKEELRLFLSEWKAGKLPKLKKVTLNTKVPARDVIVGFERWEGRCRECGWQTHVVKIKGHRNSYGCVSINLLDVPHIHMEFHDDQN